MFESYLHKRHLTVEDIADIEGMLEMTTKKPNADFMVEIIRERGLSPLLAYITDLREIIKGGFTWQKVRGTLKALRVGLSWVGVTNYEIRTNGPGVHFAEYELYLPKRPSSGQIARIAGVCELSTSARDRLIRIAHRDADIRQLDLSGGRERKLGNAIPSDLSGAIADGIKISFPKQRGHE